MLIMLSVALALAFLPVPSPAEAEEIPSFAQCRCALGGEADRDGSMLTNGALCVQSHYEERRWCDVSVHCLDDGEGPGGEACEEFQAQVLSTTMNADVENTATAMGSFFGDLIDQHRERARMLIELDPDLASPWIHEVMSRNQEAVHDCLRLFVLGDSGGHARDNFVCHVDSATGWLQLNIGSVSGRSEVWLLVSPSVAR